MVAVCVKKKLIVVLNNEMRGNWKAFVAVWFIITIQTYWFMYMEQYVCVVSWPPTVIRANIIKCVELPNPFCWEPYVLIKSCEFQDVRFKIRWRKSVKMTINICRLKCIFFIGENVLRWKWLISVEMYVVGVSCWWIFTALSTC